MRTEPFCALNLERRMDAVISFLLPVRYGVCYMIGNIKIGLAIATEVKIQGFFVDGCSSIPQI